MQFLWLGKPNTEILLLAKKTLHIASKRHLEYRVMWRYYWIYREKLKYYNHRNDLQTHPVGKSKNSETRPDDAYGTDIALLKQEILGIWRSFFALQ